MSSNAKMSFDENKKDIEQLWKIHEEYAGDGPGRKHGVDVLNKAAIIFVTACWESYIEDLAMEALDFLLANAPNALAIPTKIRDFATRSIFEKRDSRKVWELADTGWKAVLQAHKEATRERWIGKLNTPKAAQVNTLYEELLGITKLSSHWHWQNMTSEQAEAKLDGYIVVRGNIAHRTEHDETVYKNWGADYLRHVELLVEKTELAVSEEVEGVTGSKPW